MARARAVRRDALAGLLPSVTGTYTYTRREKAGTRIINGERVVLTPRDAKSADAVVDLALFDFANLPRLQAAQKDLQAERFDSADVRRALLFAVAGTFFEVLSAERQAEAAANRQKVAQQFVDDTRLKVEAGLANRNDLTRLELELASAQLVSTQTQNTLTKTRLQLGYLIGRDVNEALEEPANPEADYSASPDDVREARRPDFRSAVLRSEAARARGREPWLEWLPNLGLRLTYYPPDIAGNRQQ